MTTSPGPCVRLSHSFDPDSGWCRHGCGWRSDGRSEYQPEPWRRSPVNVVDITEPRRPQETLL